MIAFLKTRSKMIQWGILLLLLLVALLHTGLTIIRFPDFRQYSDSDGYLPYARYFADGMSNIPPGYFSTTKDELPIDFLYKRRFDFQLLPQHRAIASTPQGQLLLINLESNRIEKTIEAHASAVTSILVFSKQRWIASAGLDSCIRVWKTSDLSLVSTLCQLPSWVTSIAESPLTGTLVTGHWNGTLSLWKGRFQQVAQTLTFHRNANVSVAWADEGRAFVSSSGDGRIVKWNEHGQILSTDSNTHESTYSVFLSSPIEGKRVFSASEAGTLLIHSFDSITPSPAPDPQWGGSGAISAVAVTPKGDRVLTAYTHRGTRFDGPAMFLRETQKLQVLTHPYLGHGGQRIYAMHFSLDNAETFYSIGSDGHLMTWRLDQTHPIHDLTLANAFTPPLRKGWGGVLLDHIRQPGYPVILSWFMRLTGHHDASAAAMGQVAILLLVLITLALFLALRVGPWAGILALLPFLDPTNDIKALAYYDLTDFLLMLMAVPILIALIKIFLESPSRRDYILLITTLIVSMWIKINMGVFAIIMAFIFAFTRMVMRRRECNKRPMLKRFLLVVAVVAFLTGITRGISPGSFDFNGQAVLAKLYTRAVNDIPSFPISSIQRSDELVVQYNAFGHYAGATRFTAANSWPRIYPYLPVLGKHPLPLIDPSTHTVLDVSYEDFHRGAIFLLKHDHLVSLLKDAVSQFVIDFKNMFVFSECLRSHWAYSLLYGIVLLFGIIRLYAIRPLLTVALVTSYSIYAFYLSFATILAVRFMLLLASVNYLFFAFGILSIFELCRRGICAKENSSH